ncbi:hypothetical protein ALT1545_30002 [Alteromonas macleodii]
MGKIVAIGTKVAGMSPLLITR